MKRCCDCGEVKPLDQFFRNRTRADGLTRDCKPCRKSTSEAWKENNREACNAARRKRRANKRAGIPPKAPSIDWHKAHPELSRLAHDRCKEANPEKYREYARAWSRRNPAKVAEKGRKHREANPSRYREYAAANPDIIRAKNAKRRARRKGAGGGGISKGEMLALFADYGYRCAYCWRHGELTLDHIDPLSRGGQHDIENVVPACRSCNSKKRDRPLLVWLRSTVGRKTA